MSGKARSGKEQQMGIDGNGGVRRFGNEARRLSRGVPRPSLRRRSHPPGSAGRKEGGAPLADELDDVIVDCALYESGRRRPGRLELEQAARSAQETDGFVWIGLRAPTADQFAAVAEAFDLPALAVEDAIKAHQRPKLEVYDDVVFVVLKPVQYVDPDEVVAVSEIALFLGPNFVVTVRHGPADVLAGVRRDLDDAGSQLLTQGATAVLYAAADRVVDDYEVVAQQISIDVEDIEAQVFSGDDRDHAQRIYKLKREVLEFRRAVAPLAIPLQRLADGDVRGVNEASAQLFRDVHDHVLRAADAIETHDRMLTDILAADLAQVTVRQSLAAVRQNEDMRKISAWAAIALVPTAIAGIYGMNFEHMPELRWQYGYFLVLGLIAAVCFLLHRLFRRNGWL